MTKKILVVEDDMHIGRLVTANLTRAGFECRHAPDGVFGLEAFRETDPHLVILDVMMPRMNGYELAQRIRSNPLTKFIPVIMQTGTMTGITLGALAGGMDPESFVYQFLNAWNVFLVWQLVVIGLGAGSRGATPAAVAAGSRHRVGDRQPAAVGGRGRAGGEHAGEGKADHIARTNTVLFKRLADKNTADECNRVLTLDRHKLRLQLAVAACQGDAAVLAIASFVERAIDEDRISRAWISMSEACPRAPPKG